MTQLEHATDALLHAIRRDYTHMPPEIMDAAAVVDRLLHAEPDTVRGTCAVCQTSPSEPDAP